LKRYYVAYLWRSTEHTSWVPAGTVCDEHPLIFIANCEETWGRTLTGFQIVLTFFNEISNDGSGP
jgi:hypothetical protein